jgi:signal transduction histidine kinase
LAEQILTAEERWASWLLERNRRGTRVVLGIVLVLYPLFGLLDYIIAPREALPVIYGARLLVVLASIAMFRITRSQIFERHWPIISSGYVLVIAFVISMMTMFMEGLAAPYYAGLGLVIVGTGLLFVWPPRVVLGTHSLILASFIIPNLLLEKIGRPIIAGSNLAFLMGFAVITGAGQIVLFATQHKQVLDQIALEKTTASLASAHEQLKQLDQTKSQFFANITHEFKTPLAMILSPLELLLAGDLGELNTTMLTTFESMFHNGMKLLKMIGDLLDLSRLEESKLRLNVKEQELVVYLRELCDQLLPLTQRKNIQLAFSSNVETCLCYCDLERMERVFLNLLSNATKFTPPGGHMKVSLHADERSVTVVVEDDGPGFPPDKAEKLFERFFQVDMGGTRRYGGTGIGLALAKEIVELHGGEIRAESPGTGARFTVMILRDREHFRPEVLDRRGPARDVSQGQRGSDLGLTDFAVQMSQRDEYRLLDIHEATERRISVRDLDENERSHLALIVDDTPDIVRLVHNSLRSHFKVLSADDGLKGLEMALRERPSLIITDLMMPEIDGLELTKRLRADDRTKHIPIVMLTARGDLEDRVAGLETGVSAYLAKPFSPRELLTTARALVQAQATTADLVMTQKMDSLEIVAGGLAHEINNPLNYLKNSLARLRIDARILLAETKLTDTKKMEKRINDLFDVAESGIKRITATVELMSSYGRAGYSRTLRPYDAFTAAREAVAMVLPATRRSVKVDLELPGDGTVECVPEELNQLISNLIQNAIEACPEENGAVKVSGAASDDKLVLRVKDNGPGIPADVIARIFTPFFTTKGPGRGMGMGLTICWRVVQSLGGTLEAKPGAGAEFVVTLPRKQPGLRAAS